jgi:competence protein ComEC
MYRPFLFIVLFLILGILVANLIKYMWVFLILAIIDLVFLILSREKRIKHILLGLLILFMGAVYYNFRVEGMTGTIGDFAGKNRTIVGVVSDSPELRADKITYKVKALYLIENDGNKRVSGMVLLSIPRDEKHNKAYNYGDVIRLSGKLKTPQGKRNPGGIDYKAYLLQKGISATMFSRSSQKVGEYGVNPFIRAAFCIRERLITFYDEYLLENLSSLLTGMSLGFTGRISGDVLRAFSDAGVIHVLAVSGLHVGIIYGAAWKLINFFDVSKLTSFLVGSSVVVFYCFVAGMPPSAVRASIMIWITLLGGVVGRRGDPINSLSLAAIVILTINPTNLFSIGFQLSFAATLGIILFYEQFKQMFLPLPGFVRDVMAVVISAQLIVLPVSAYYFNRISLIGFLANLIIVPIASLALVIGFIGGFVGLILPLLGKPIFYIDGMLLAIIQKTSIFFAQLPFSSVVIPSFPVVFIIIYYFLLLVIFGRFKTFNKLEKYKTSAIAVLMLLFVIAIFPKHNGLEVTFIDVGQGDSILIHTPNKKTVLIDGGGMPPFYKGDFDIGRDVVQPFLQFRGIRSIQVLVFSHFDSDHSEGLLSILENMRVDTVVYGIADQGEIYEQMVEIIKNKGIRAVQAAKGDEFIIGDVLFEILSPPKSGIPGATDNDNSLVLKMTYKDFSFLFTGDLEHAGEVEILSSGLDIRSSVLKVGHHGSSSSTSADFLGRVKPAFAVISAGCDNSFGHPSQQVVELLNHNDVQIFRTDVHGGITFKVTEKDVKIFTSVPEE